jgi:glycogen operon protein
VDPATGDLVIRVRSERATRLRLELFATATGEDAQLREVLVRSTDEPVWTARIAGDRLRAAGLALPYLYGLRAWGPNWTFDPAWEPGRHEGFVADVDADGHHFDPNKLLVDPHARELTHDPVSRAWTDFGPYMGGEGHRDEDSARMAPKSVALVDVPPASTPRPAKPTRAFADDVVYEAHVRGFTKLDPSVPEDERGTYAGAARKARYLRDLGVTAVELLPIHETQNEQNDLVESTEGANYWGYSSLSFFAPERRYARDRSLGGPTRELRAMIDAFHAEGIKVLLDVVYNHTAEGKAGADPGKVPLLSLRGLDGPTYYVGAPDRRFDMDHNGVGADLAVARIGARDLVLASLAYYVEDIGVDGFRFDLASVLGNRCEVGCFAFDANREGGLLREIPARLGARPGVGGKGVDLVAEPWAIGEGTYQLGHFPAGWAEWNDRFRGAVRRAQNRFGVADVPLGELAARVSGSLDVFGARGARAGVSFVVAHDGMTLADLYTYDGKQNAQAWPFGPSDGGTDDDLAWSQGGDRAAQVRASRVGMALLAVSRGTPMLVMGDERRRSQRGNNNAYNLDALGSWMNWSSTAEADGFASFTGALLAQRRSLAALRSGFAPQGRDGDGDGVADVAWLRADGSPADEATWASPSAPLVVRLDAREADPASLVRSVLVVYQRAPSSSAIALPRPRTGLAWRRAVDTSADVPASLPGEETPLAGDTYPLQGRSLVVLVER